MNQKDVRGCVVILALALLLGFGINAVSPSGIALFGQWDKAAGVVMAGAKRGDAVKAGEVNNPLKVRRMIKNGETVLVDVRRSDIYDQGHIPGALSFPLHEFDDRIPEFTAAVEKTAAVLVYCSGVTCSESHRFAARIIKMGYARVTVYAGGFAEWSDMEFEVERNAG